MADEKIKQTGKIEKETKEKAEAKQTEKKEEKKIEVKKIKKDYALVNGMDIHASPKELISICNMIRGRKVDTAIKMVEEVLVFKRVVKMNNREVPHQHGKGVMAGRYPLNACKEVLSLLKHLRANAIYNELELEKAIISCNANIASKPYKRGGARFKRAHVMIRLDKAKEENSNKKENKTGAKK
jgi:ribosomal protein L22